MVQAAMGRTIDDARGVALALIATRAPGATVCPSEVARALELDDDATAWRAVMPLVHRAVDDLLAQRAIELSWNGEELSTRAGPYRISRRSDGKP